MLNKLNRLVQRLLRNDTFTSSDELYLYLILQVAALFALIVHVGLLVLHLIGGFYGLAQFNIAYIILYFILRAMLDAHKGYKFVGYTITLFVTLHATITVLLTGTGTFKVFYFFVALVMQVIIPYTSAKGRFFMGALLWACLMFTAFFASLYTPRIDLGGIALAVTVFNVQVGFLGIVLELMIGNQIKRVIEHYNATRMKELRGQANTDQLTGLYNRYYAHACFAKIAEDPETKWSMALLDIDNFKILNDKYGHATGDEALQKMAQAMKDKLRKSDYIFRWGGEEFLVLLRDADLEAARRIMDDLRVKISGITVSTEGQQKRNITVSVGVTELNLEDVDASIEECDKKMYEGKSKGKNIVVA